MRSSITIAVTVLLGACGATDEGDDVDDLADVGDLAAFGVDGTVELPGTWTDVGLGVAYQQVNTGHAVVIAYGGYTAQLAYSAAWASELVDARLGAANVGHVYAVKGPQDADYASREIANSKLRAHLATIDDGVSSIYVVAHSSGAFVAHELLAQLHAAGATDELARIAYANLDGGGSGLTTAIAAELGRLAFVYARDPSLAQGLSQNSGAAMALGVTYAAYGAAFEVRVPDTGCASGAGWCLHDVVITHRPHDPSSYDLAQDYTDFVDRPVTTEYFAPLIGATD
jgi:hypothetical protein